MNSDKIYFFKATLAGMLLVRCGTDPVLLLSEPYSCQAQDWVQKTLNMIFGQTILKRCLCRSTLQPTRHKWMPCTQKCKYTSRLPSYSFYWSDKSSLAILFVFIKLTIIRWNNGLWEFSLSRGNFVLCALYPLLFSGWSFWSGHEVTKRLVWELEVIVPFP